MRSAREHNLQTYIPPNATQGKCPSGSDSRFAVCVRRIVRLRSCEAFKEGRRLYLPLLLLHVWTSQWYQWIDSKHPQLRLQLVIGHNKYTSKTDETMGTVSKLTDAFEEISFVGLQSLDTWMSETPSRIRYSASTTVTTGVNASLDHNSTVITTVIGSPV